MMKVIPADSRHRITYMYDKEACGVREGKSYKGIVIALMDDCTLDAFDDLFDNIKEILAINWKEFKLENSYKMKSSFKGVAYCSVEDNFDLKTGMRIARKRLLKKFHNDKRRVFTDVYNFIHPVDKALADMIELERKWS